ncbi:hypothetical protein ACOMHN_009677 [Nucella lapillus]
MGNEMRSDITYLKETYDDIKQERPECESGDLAATECAGLNDRFCMKYTAESERLDTIATFPYLFSAEPGQFVYRSCSPVEMKECRTTSMYGQQMVVCFYTCYTDGCNAAATVRRGPSASATSSAAAAVVVAVLMATLAFAYDYCYGYVVFSFAAALVAAAL